MLRRKPKWIIAMLHVPALPGSPRSTLSWDAVGEWVMRDAEALAAAGVDAMILENFGDTPFYPDTVPPHTIAQMTALAVQLRRRFSIPLGINVLRNDGRAALAVAAASGAEFIRVNVYTGARLTDQGIIQARAHEIQRDRKLLSAHIAIWADIAVKHSAPLAQRPLRDEIEDTLLRAGADAVILSGAATGKQTPLDLIEEAKAIARDKPVLAGSGVTAETIREVLARCDGAIVGTSLKTGGLPSDPVDPHRARRLMDIVRAI